MLHHQRSSAVLLAADRVQRALFFLADLRQNAFRNFSERNVLWTAVPRRFDEDAEVAGGGQ